MKTDDLIRAMAADTTIARSLPSTLMAGMIPALAIGAALLWVALGLREDIVNSFGNPVSVARFVLTGCLGFFASQLALRLARPEGLQRQLLWPLAVVAAVAMGLLAWSYLTTPVEGRQMALVGKTVTTCLVTIPLLSILPVTAVLITLRGGATTAPRFASFVAGLCGGGFAAMIYASHCSEDSPLFYVTWYSLAIFGVALLSTLAGPRFLRW